MTNKWIEYYGEKKISPVKQDISNLDNHFAKREKLYRQLGIPSIFFENKKILEVGPGSGYNTLAFLAWGGHVTLVEPNQTGSEEMKQLFRQMGIDSNKFSIIQSAIEDIGLDESYDIVIAEGFIHACDNANEIIGILEQFVRPGGVIVITCMDYEGMFVEQMQRLIFQQEVRAIGVYEEKVAYISNIIKQYDKLKGRSRSIEDWVRDDILNPAFNNENILSFEKALDCFSDNFDYLGSSQSIFTDYSWYKDLEYDERVEIKYQVRMKRHNFLMTGIREQLLSEQDTDFLYSKICRIRNAAIQYENNFSNSVKKKIVENLEDILPVLEKVDKRCWSFAEQCISLLANGMETVEKKDIFFSAVGRTQQYLVYRSLINYTIFLPKILINTEFFGCS